MRQIQSAELLTVVKIFNEQERDWYWHCFQPGSQFNHHEGEYIVVVEADNWEILYARYNKYPTSAVEQLRLLSDERSNH